MINQLSKQTINIQYNKIDTLIVLMILRSMIIIGSYKENFY